MFKQLLWSGASGLAIALSVSSAIAITVQEVPNPRQTNGWVADTANIISPATENQLNQLISGLEALNGTEIAVVTVSSTVPAATPKEFATELFNTWGIGKDEQDNGVLFLISVGDRRTEIETGYGVEPYLPDAKAGRLLRQEVVPQFRQGNYDQGILAGTQSLVSTLETADYSSSALLRQRAFSTAGGLLVLLFSPTGAIAGAGVAASIFNYRRTQRLIHTPMLLTPNGYTQTEENPEQSLKAAACLTTLCTTASVIYLGLSAVGVGLFSLIPAAIGGLAGMVPLSKYWFKPSTLTRQRCCATCQHPLQVVEAAELSDRLSPAQKTAQQLGSTAYEGWVCPHCTGSVRDRLGSPPPETLSDIHLIAYEQPSNGYSRCPSCHELTVKQTLKTLKEATYQHEGQVHCLEECQCCAYQQESVNTVPRLVRSSSTTGSSSGFSSSSSSGGGGSFGGGSSGGGGAGADW